jgi:hypothetical protein
MQLAQCLSTLLCCLFLAGCASTTVSLTPSPQAPVCDSTTAALVLWAPAWRPDQKDAPEREAAAAAGLKRFFESAGCFARSEVRRVADLSPATTVAAQTAPATGPSMRTVVIAVRELGPVVSVLSSAALVEGHTEVVLQITAYPGPGGTPPREFTVQWRNGGPGVVKGVASLPRDMHDALVSGLQPGMAPR